MKQPRPLHPRRKRLQPRAEQGTQTHNPLSRCLFVLCLLLWTAPTLLQPSPTQANTPTTPATAPATQP
ncbi:MAG: hypothetical protein AAF750_17690, partial [Planctomycetota bacterium]